MESPTAGARDRLRPAGSGPDRRHNRCVPELPEVETVRLGLEQSVLGAVVTSAKVLGRRTVRRQSPRTFERLVAGRRIEAVGRRGKFLFVTFDRGTLLVHLRMSGQLLLVTDPALPLAPHTHAVLSLADGRELRFVDPRTFGELCFYAPDSVELDAVLTGLGIDPLTDGVDADQLASLCNGRRNAIKTLLLDQKKICGIGNIYADEICFVAKVRPDRLAGSLKRAELARLAVAIKEVLSRAVKDRGSSLRDARYRDLFGEPGAFQSRHAVYGRTGEPCLACGRPIVGIRIAGRSAHFCRKCQR